MDDMMPQTTMMPQATTMPDPGMPGMQQDPTVHPVFGMDPVMGLSQPHFDKAVDYFTATLLAVSVVLTLLAAIHTIRLSMAKKAPLMILSSIYSTTMTLGELAALFWMTWSPSFYMAFFFSIFMGLSMLFFVLAQTETIRVVMQSSSRADTLIFRWRIVHNVVHLATALPLYIMYILPVANASNAVMQAFMNWNVLVIVWHAYIYTFDIFTTLWIARNLYIHVKKRIDMTSSLKMSSTNLKSDATLIATAESISSNHQALNPPKPKPKGAEDLNVKYYRSLVLTTVMILTDILTIIFMSLSFASNMDMYGSDESIYAFTYMFLSYGFMGIHVSLAVALYGFLADIFTHRATM